MWNFYSMALEKVFCIFTNIFCREKVLKYQMPVRICFCFIWSISLSLRSSWSTFLLVLSLSHFKKYVDNIYLNISSDTKNIIIYSGVINTMRLNHYYFRKENHLLQTVSWTKISEVALTLPWTLSRLVFTFRITQFNIVSG